MRNLASALGTTPAFLISPAPAGFNEETVMPGRQVEDLKARKNEQDRAKQKTQPQDREKHNGTKEDGKTQRGGQENKGQQNR
jgi:hypothetical protein